MSKFIAAIATLLGTIIGVGFLGLPYVAAQSGFLLVAVYLIVLGCVMCLIHLAWGEIVLRTPGKVRLPGVVAHYFGRRAENLVLLNFSLGLIGTLLAYIIIGGQFLGSLIGTSFVGSELLYALVFFSVGSLLIYRDVKSIVRTEVWMMGAFFLVLILFLFSSFSKIKIDNLVLAPALNLTNLILPYGIVLFSLAGNSVIPEIIDILGKKKMSHTLEHQEAAKLPKVVGLATVIVVATYIIFTILVFGITGKYASDEALSGLSFDLPRQILRFLFLLGFLAVFTSFLSIGLAFKKMLWYDYKLTPSLAWFLSMFVPLSLFLAGAKNYLAVIGLVGAISIGIEGVVIFVTYKKARRASDFVPAYDLKLPNWSLYLFMFAFILAALYEIWRSL
jgi:amino acid permease